MKKKVRLNIGDNLKSTIGGFSFGKNTPKNFDKHISKSVPLYNHGHEIITKLSSFFLEKKSTFYDLGCSTGTLIKKIDAYNSSLKLNIIGIDLQKKMILKAKKKNLKNYNKANFKCLDILKIKFKKSDLITSYYTINQTSLKQ
jgi:Predicted DNA modification methylase